MKKVNGIFLGKTKVSNDSKYINGVGLDEDILKTEMITKCFKHELETVIDMCYERHFKNFKQYETAIDILQETLREKFIEYGEKL
jgi:hypothetical protein